MNEEELNQTAPVEENPNEDGFMDERPVDEVPQEPAPEPKPEPEPEPEPAPRPVREKKDRYDYEDPRLQAIENARIIWNKSYQRLSLIKTFVAVGVLIAIAVGWIVPTTVMKDAGAVPLYIALGIAAAGIIGLVVFGFFQKKHDKKAIAAYFAAYYDNQNAYVFDGLGIDNIQGTYETKVSPEEVEACKLYPECTSIGSRENITFTYNGMDCALADMAVQKNVSRGLKTVFVGKYLRTHNTLKFDGPGELIIYFKGNERAIPPLAIENLTPLEESAKYSVYGPASLKPVLTRQIRAELKKITTNDLLVDVAITLTEGRCYFALGYEDDLMVLPGRDAFDPEFVMQYKQEIRSILDIALKLNA